MSLRPPALTGIRVVEAAAFITGPFSAAMLADLGAEVVKIEPPDGDPYRRFGRTVDGLSIAFANVNRGKRILFADLKTDEGRATLGDELAEADVFITNWRAGVADSLGLTAEAVRTRYPRLIWVRITGFGPTGPMARHPAFDAVVQARSGLLFTQGAPDGPQMVRGYLVDKVTAVFAAQTALAALVGRGSDGPGEIIDLSMIDALSYFDAPDILGERTLLRDVDRPSVNPQLGTLRAVPTSDGWLLTAPVRGKQIRGAAEAAGHPEWVAELRKIDDPVALTLRFYALLASVTPSATTQEWVRRMEEHDVPASAVLDLDEHLADAQVLHNETYAVIDDPLWGPTRQANYPARSTDRAMSTPGPLPHRR